jgi:23S rRNA pseudouridine1911/1915/1917 synthase
MPKRPPRTPKAPRKPSATREPEPRAVPEELGGKPLDAVVRSLFSVSWGEARSRIETGKVAVDDVVRTNEQTRVRAGCKVAIRMSAPRPRIKEGTLDDTAIVYWDTHVVVVDKPAGVSTVPYEEGERGTLDERVRDWIGHHDGRHGGGPRPPLGVVHRLDKETSGLIVFTRTWLAKQSLSSQFRAHTAHRRYLAIVHDNPDAVPPKLVREGTIRSHLIVDRGDGLRGSVESLPRGRARGEQGQLAITHVEVLERLAAGASLVACRLETGRTHQIRIHLSEAGHPLVGERVYIRRYEGPVLGAPRMMLHAAELGFDHPATELPVDWEVPPPADFAETLARLRQKT